MAGNAVAVAIGGGALTRDAFLRDALRRGAREALWIDPSLGWAERYRRPERRERPGGGHDGGGGRPAVHGVGSTPEARFTRRELLWPGEAGFWTP